MLAAAVILALFAVVLAGGAFWLAGKAVRISRQSGMAAKRLATLDPDVVEGLLDRAAAIDAANVALDQLGALVQATRDDIAHSLRHVAVVRYDAFRDITGRMSYSTAILDDTGDGVVLTSLHGRTETQTFAKAVRVGEAEGLTPEEEQAVAHAWKGGVTS